MAHIETPGRTRFSQVSMLPMLGYVLRIVVLVGFSTGCAARGDPTAQVGVVQQFIAGLEAQDSEQILAQLPPDGTRRQFAPELRLYFQAVERLVFHEPQYTVLESTRRTARVRLNASLEYTLVGDINGRQAIEADFLLVYQESNWYLETITWPTIGKESP